MIRPPVLIVDDSLTIRMDLADALAAAGFDARPVGDLAHARRMLASERFDLVVLDVVLPDGDGLDLLREIKHAAERVLPVMLLSTEAEVASRIRGLSAGADEYVGKPYDLRQVIARAWALVHARVQAEPSADRRVLLIDDSATYRHAMREALEHAGYEVHEAASGEEGLALAPMLRPDAIIIDGVLPGIDGATVVRRLKADLTMRGVPCLLLTGSDTVDDELRALEAGADGFLRKREDLDVLVVRVRGCLRSAPVREAGASALLAPKRLLAVDDSPTYLQALSAELRADGYDVVLARSGAEALELLEAQPVDCILLDLVMPGLSGEETCRRIKASPRWRDLPLVMLTAHENRETMIAGINAGADDFIAKSAELDVLKARLRAQLRRKHFEDENRRIREQLVRRETEARFHRLLQSNVIGVTLGTLDGGLLDGNDAFLTMTGWSRADLDAGLRWDTMVSGECSHVLRALLEQLRASGTTPTTPLVLTRKDGGRVPVLVGAVRLDDSDHVVAVIVDRTEQHAAEERLAEANRELARAKHRAEEESRYKSTFLASMSHELRTPLNAIIGFSELLDQELFGGLSDRQREFVGYVLTSGRHLLTLVNDILDLSKVEAGRMELSREWVALPTLSEAVRSILRPLSDKRSVSVTLAIPPDLPDLYADPVRIKQVLYNLLSNAIKFTDAGGTVTLSATVAEREVRIACRDTGVGIRAEDLPRMFREFEQLEQPSARPREGTGLGLALTRRLVELHGGTIAVESTRGVGTTFTFTVPISPRTGAAAEAVASAEPYVLVIEDEPQAATLLTRYVRSVGLAAEHARDAREALAIIARQRPAGITVDTTLPGIDGWGLLTRLRGDPATATIPVVVISVEDDAAQSVALGASEHLVKPVARSVLADALERARVPIHRVAGLRVAIARTARPKLDAVASALREAGCVLEPVAVGGAVPDAIDVAIVDPALEAVASAFAARGVPILDLARVEADVDARERLIRQVRLAADRRRR